MPTVQLDEKQWMTIAGPADIKMGDVFTISGIYEEVKNPDRKWWQFWKPKMVSSGLKKFHVTNVVGGRRV